MIFMRLLICAFCSMCYQLLTARTLAELTHEYILSYSLSFGFFLLGMGLGGIYYGRSLSHKNPLNVFCIIEILLAIFGGLAVFFILSLFVFMNVSFFSDRYTYFTKDVFPYVFLLVTQFFIFLIGFLSGWELPVWLKIKETKKSSFPILNGTGALLGAGYIGGFLGSVLVTLLIVPVFGVLKTCILIGFINIAILIESLISHKNLTIKNGVVLFIPMIILYICGTKDRELMQLHLKTWYLKTELAHFNIENIKWIFKFTKSHKDILRIESSYQNIDIIPKEFLKYSIPYLDLYGKGMAFYLNRQPQFFSNFWKTYHESIVTGGPVLTGKEPENILILGGGDGLLVSQIIEFYKNFKTITLVEIDPAMIKLAKNYKPLSQLNQQAFKNKKVNIIIDDAFTYIAKDKKKYDAIFIDFPFPRSFDLSRLYSIEFYKRVKNRLTKDGFIILDVPIWKDLYNETINVKPMPQDILYSTLTHAGYKTIFAFGKMEPFLFLQIDKKNISLKKKEIKYKVSEQTRKNLISIHNILEDVEIKNEYINSVFKPVRFKY